jgi:ribonuclease P protein component
MGHFNINVFITGIVLSIMVSILLLREQYMVSDKEWLKRMISHHSTALTTSHKIKERTKDNKIKRLAEEIIETQEKEIKIMKSWL